MEYKDYYKILGIDKSASKDDIKKAYRKLAKKYHPDANPNNKQAEEKFKDINEAYEVLGDPDRRRKYDNFGQEYNFHSGSSFDPSQFGFGNNVRYEYRTNSAGDFSDFFNMFFGGGSGFDVENIFGNAAETHRGFNYESNGKDIEAEIEIIPEEGFNGIEKKITLRSHSGEKSLTFRIPKGVKDGEKIRLSGQGEPGVNGGRNGDLYLTVRFKKGHRFEADGMDLHTTADVLPWEAALGEEIPVETIDGKILVKIPAGIRSDEKIRIGGKGYIDRHERRGDLYIKIRIVNPDVITPQAKKLYGKLKELYKR